MSSQTATDLRVAATILCREGWTAECNGDVSVGRHCVIDAIALAVSPSGWSDQGWDETTGRRYTAAAQALRDHLRGRIAPWQEDPARTADEVIAALEAAADSVEPQP